MEYKYKNITDFRKEHQSEYHFLIKEKLLEKLCIDMNWKIRFPIGFWTKEKCHAEALKYKTKSEWKKNSESSYNYSLKNKWVDEHSTHMTSIQKQSGYWTKEKCLEDALKYNTISEWKKNGNSSYSKAHKKKWVGECASHMVKVQKPRGYWTKEKCYAEALKYKTKSEWQKSDNSSHKASKRLGIFDECTEHMC